MQTIDKMTTTDNNNNKIAPKLRFKGFDGEWKKMLYADIYTFYSTNSFSRDNLNYDNGNVKNIHYGDIHTKFATLFDIAKEEVPFVNSDIDISKIKEENYCQEKDLVIADASEDYADIGKTIELVNLNNNKIIAGLHTFLARPNKHEMAKGFAGYLVKSWKFKKQVMIIAQGTKVLSLSTGRLGNLELSIPTLPEQQKIASFLSAVDEKIQQLSRKKELLAQYKKGVMQRLFSLNYDSFDLHDEHDFEEEKNQGNQKNHTKSRFRQLRFKDQNGMDFPVWEEKKLGEVATLNPKSSVLPESFIYIDLESVEKGQLLKENIISKTEAPSRAQRKLSKNDILYQTVRPYQMNNYLFDKNGEYVASTGYAQLRAKESASFLYQLLHTEYFINDVMERCTGTSYPSINSFDLSQIKFKIPCLAEQKKIADYLSHLDVKIEQVTKQIDQTQSFKKGLLQQMFV